MRIMRLMFGLLGSVVLSGCVSGGGTRIDNIPMYGQPGIERPEFLKKADAEFIEKAASGIGSREAASKAWWSEGERHVSEGNLDYAMRRYNQSWLLNPDNYQPYWGFGRVMDAMDQYEEAFKYFKRANELINDPYQKPALLTDTAVTYHNKANSLPKSQQQERQKYFDLANSYFDNGTKADPTYPKAWLRWAQSLYFQGNYSASWSKIKKARELDPSLVPNKFINDLSSKLPEPKL
jgi:tetratricopeptide (TPR) repeat protein